MDRKFISLLFLILVFFGCKSKQTKFCKEKIYIIQELVGDRIFTNSDVYLDSALVLIRQIEDKCPKFKNNIRISKAEIFNYKKNYDSALYLINSMDGGFFFAGFKEVLINKVKVNQAKMDNDTLKIDSLYRLIINDYEKYLQDNMVILKPVLRMMRETAISMTPANFVLEELFYYKFQLEGADKVAHEIDSLQNAINGNEIYFRDLKESFSGNQNLKYDIFFN